MSETERVAIVTGAAGGIGRALVGGLLGAGLRVAAVDRDAGGLALLAEHARERQQGANLLTIEADLARDEAPAEIVMAARARFGTIDILVNNAGVGQATIRTDNRERPIKFWEVTPEQWNQFLAVNATAPIMMARAVLPHMLKANRGRIITVTTSLGTMVREGYLLYGSSKAAAEAAMAVLAADLAGTGITANVLVPGGVTDTPLVGDAGDRSKMLRPDIMVPPLLWLVSDEAVEVSGRRFIAADWDTRLPPAQAAEAAGAPVAWLSIARMPIEPG